MLRSYILIETAALILLQLLLNALQTSDECRTASKEGHRVVHFYDLLVIQRSLNEMFSRGRGIFLLPLTLNLIQLKTGTSFSRLGILIRGYRTPGISTFKF